jgi:hypothetical protein
LEKLQFLVGGRPVKNGIGHLLFATGALMLISPPTEAPAKHWHLAERPFSSVHQLQ